MGWSLSCLSRALSVPLTSLSPTSPTRRLLSSVPVRKVTRSNFEATLEELRGVFRESDFLAFDLEMSGVTSAPWRDSSPLDDPDVQYLKLKDSASKFAVLQFGICPFRWDPSRESFIARPYNFYLFSQPDILVDGPASHFLCQTSSLEFLARHQFDFNAWIHDGITYLSKAQESEMQHAFLSTKETKIHFTSNLEEPFEMPLVRTADVLFTERIKTKLFEWRNGILKSCMVGRNPDCPKNQFQTIFFKMRPAILLDNFSCHQQKLIELVIQKHFKDLIYIRSNAGDSVKRMVVYSASDGDRTLLMKEVWEDCWEITKEKIKSATGFRHIIDLLAAEQKLMVGHSCILDIMHMHHKFVGPLPSTATEFANSFHGHFPHLIDTKNLLKSLNFQHHLDKRGNKSLSYIFSRLCPDMSDVQNIPYRQLVKIEVKEDEKRSSNAGTKHEAGYDAFMTGSVFVQACAHMGIDFKLLSQPLELVKHEKLQNYKNLVWLGWRNETIMDLMTGARTLHSRILPNEKREIDPTNILLLWGFSPKIKPSDLKQCLSEVYGLDSIASVFYLDETTALVQFSRQELVGKFLHLKDSLERNNDVISVLHPLSLLLQGGNTRAASYSVYREICSSSISKFLFADQAEAIGITWMTKLETGDIKANSAEADTPLMSTGEAEGRSKKVSKGNLNADGGSSFPCESNAQLSCKAIMDSLHELNKDSESQVQFGRL